jgi:hypothetical protein
MTFKLNQNQTRSPIFEHLNAIWKNVYSIVIARRRVFTQPRPRAEVAVGGARTKSTQTLQKA